MSHGVARQDSGLLVPGWWEAGCLIVAAAETRCSARPLPYLSKHMQMNPEGHCLIAHQSTDKNDESDQAKTQQKCMHSWRSIQHRQLPKSLIEPRRLTTRAFSSIQIEEEEEKEKRSCRDFWLQDIFHAACWRLESPQPCCGVAACLTFACCFFWSSQANSKDLFHRSSTCSRPFRSASW